MIAEVRKLMKRYPSFVLGEVSFGLEKGRITGFISRNGAGKTTTIKAMLNLIHPDSGDVRFFGMPIVGNETDIKKRIGYSTGAVSWYPRKKIRDIVEIVKRFYETWDDTTYRNYLELFSIDEMKTPLELSEGMKVKLNFDSLVRTEPVEGVGMIPPAPRGKNIWGSVAVSDRGQIVIPKGARELFGLTGGQRLIVFSDEQGERCFFVTNQCTYDNP